MRLVIGRLSLSSCFDVSQAISSVHPEITLDFTQGLSWILATPDAFEGVFGQEYVLQFIHIKLPRHRHWARITPPGKIDERLPTVRFITSCLNR